MGLYRKEFCPIKNAVGEKMVSLLIQPSFELSVYFEIYHAEDKYYLYWNYELLPEEFVPVMKQFAHEGMTVPNAFQDPTIINEVSKLSVTYSTELAPKESALIQEFSRNKLPDLNHLPPMGLDGTGFKFQFGEDPKEYSCWCVIPHEWESIMPVIELLTNKLDLGKSYRVYGIK